MDGSDCRQCNAVCRADEHNCTADGNMVTVLCGRMSQYSDSGGGGMAVGSQ